jgi:hypothetical protein
MSDAHRPVPHPRPEPSKPRPQPASAVTHAEPRPAPVRLEPDRPAPLRPELPGDGDGNGDAQLSRAERRRAEKDAGRRQTLRLGLQIAGALLAVIVVVAVVLAVTSGGGAGHKPPATATKTPAATGANLADPGRAVTFLGAAASDVAAVTTYDYRKLDDALNAGLPVTVGAYREAYRTALTGDLARTATAEHVVHTFELLDIGIGQMNASGTVAKVLVFGRQRINDDRTGPNTQVSPITLTVTIRRDGSRYRISDLVEGMDAGLPPGGPDLAVAAAAGRDEVVNLLSYRRADFDTDVQRAVSGATSPLREQITKDAPATKQAMIKGKYDTTGTVTASAVVRADAETVTFLVAADAGRLVDGTTAPTVSQQRYEVTVTRTLDGWAVSRVSSVDGGG